LGYCRAADRELEDRGFFHGELVQRKPQHDREGPERRKPLDARAGPQSELGRVDHVVLGESVARVEENQPREPHLFRDREVELEVHQRHRVAADHVRRVEVREVVDLLVLELVADVPRLAVASLHARDARVEHVAAERREQALASGSPRGEDGAARAERALLEPRTWNAPMPPRK
jgi:hypothetical protein